jgi:hypothetical protein
MKPLCKMIALVLLVVVSPVLFGQVFVLGPAQSPQPRQAGCHEHGQEVPSPSPVTYQCCRVGHQFAAVREPVDFRSRLSSLSPAMEFVVPRLAWATGQARLQLWSPAFGPPSVTSLRI